MVATDSVFSSTPYPGLRPFRSDESDIFFGREEQIDTLLEKLQLNRFVAIVGASGCGKSSLVRAGLIAGLESGLMGDVGPRWRIADMRPGSGPLLRLAEAIEDEGALRPELVKHGNTLPLLLAQLRRGPRGLVDVVREARLPPGTNLVLLVDQFEEIFRFRRLGDPNAADAFVALLLASAEQREVPIYVVMTMRSDFLGDCALFRGLPEAINQSQYLTPRLTREQIHAAIIGPARVFGGDVDQALANRLINDVGPDPDQLPVLQHALMRMWGLAKARDAAQGGSSSVAQRSLVMSLEHYDQIGGLSEALSRHADEVFARLPSNEQSIAEAMFRSLTERGEGRRDTRRPAATIEVASVAGVSIEQLTRIADAFRAPDVSFITPPMGTPIHPNTVLDIAHESLIRLWTKLADWVDAEATKAATYVTLRQNAAGWHAGEVAPPVGRPLKRMLQWWKDVSPTKAWAKRYGTNEDFSLALLFLEAGKGLERQQSRHKWALGGAFALLVLGSVGGVAYTAWNAAREMRSRDLAVASAEMLRVNRDRGLVIAMRALCAKETHWAKAGVLRALLERRREKFFRPDPARVDTALYSDDGIRVVAKRDLDVTGSAPGSVLEFWDPIANKPFSPPWTLAASPEKVAYSPRNSMLAVLLDDPKANVTRRILIRKLDADVKTQRVITPSRAVESMAIDREGRLLAAALEGGVIVLWDARSGELYKRLTNRTGQSRAGSGLVFSPDGSKLLVTRIVKDHVGSSDVALIFDTISGELVSRLERPNLVADLSKAWGWAAGWTYDSAKVITVDSAGLVRTWDVRSGRQSAEMHSGVIFPSGVSVSPDGLHLALVGLDGLLRVLDVETQQETIFNDRSNWVLSAVFGSDSREIVSVAGDGSLQVWGLLDTLRVQLKGSTIKSASFSPVAKLIAMGESTGEIVLQNQDRWTERRRLRGNVPAQVEHGNFKAPNFVHDVKFSSDGHSLAAGYEDGHARIWDVDSGLLRVKTGIAHEYRVTCVGLSNDGARLLTTSSDDKSVKMWDARIGSQIGATLTFAKNDNEGPVCAGFSEDDKTALVVGTHGNLYAWDPEQSERPRVFRKSAKENDNVLAAKISADGRKVALILLSGNALILDTQSRQDPIELFNQRWLTDFSIDGSRIGSLDDGGAVNVWDVSSGLSVWELPGNRSSFGVVAMSSTADRLLRAGGETADVFDCELCGPFGAARSKADQAVISILKASAIGKEIPTGRLRCADYEAAR